MTPLLFLLLYTFGCAATLFASANYGLYTYYLAYHMSPIDTWWENSVPNLRYLQISAILALLVTFSKVKTVHGETFAQQPGPRLVLLFNAWIWLVSIWAIAPTHISGCIVFGKHLLIMYVVYEISKQSVTVFRNVLLAIVIGTGWFGWIMLGKSGRVENVAGAISDANTFGMYSSASLMLASAMVLGMERRYRYAAFACTPFILNNIILAGSRGAFLATIVGGTVLWWFCPPKLNARFKLLASLGVVLFLMLAHDQFMERITAMFQVAEGERKPDNSAASRLEYAAAGWRMFKDYPLGVGTRGTAFLSPKYMREELLTGDGKSRENLSRGAHNSYLDALVAYGFPGFLIYLWFFWWAIRTTRRIRNSALARRDEDLAVVATGLAACVSVVFTAGHFTSFVDFENQFWFFGLIAAASVIDKRDATDAERMLRGDGSLNAPGAGA